MESFENKVIWITGASSGIGEALAYAFAQQGAELVLSARRPAELERVKKNCTNPAKVEILAMDLGVTDELPAKVEWVLSRKGRIDILVNNAGISQRSEARETSLQVYRDIMEVNFFGTIHLSNLVMKHFLLRDAGLFVVISSITGKVGLPLRTAYTASKHAIEGFYASLKTEIWKTNLKVLLVRPASIKTNIAQNALTGDGGTFNKVDKVIEGGISTGALAASVLKAILADKKVLYAGMKSQLFIVKLEPFLPKFVFNIVKKIKP